MPDGSFCSFPSRCNNSISFLSDVVLTIVCFGHRFLTQNTILEVACGRGRYLAPLAKLGHNILISCFTLIVLHTHKSV